MARSRAQGFFLSGSGAVLLCLVAEQYCCVWYRSTSFEFFLGVHPGGSPGVLPAGALGNPNPKEEPLADRAVPGSGALGLCLAAQHNQETQPEFPFKKIAWNKARPQHGH